MKNSELVLTVVGTGLEAVLCLLFFVRRYYRDFPIFFAYTATAYSKGEIMRKSMIRLVVAVALLISGSLVPVYAANNPMPVPWPPIHHN